MYLLLEGDWSRLDGAKYTEKQAYEESCLKVVLKPEVVEAAHLLCAAFNDLLPLAKSAKCVLFGVREGSLPTGTTSEDVCKTVFTKGGKVPMYKDSTAFRLGQKTSNSKFVTAVASVDLSTLMGVINKADVELKTASIKGG